MTVFNVRHITTYRYRRPVAFGEHRMMFRPRDSYDQRLLACTQAIVPEPSELRWVHDVFGNCVTIAHFRGLARELRFETNIAVEHTDALTPDFRLENYARHYPFTYASDELPDLSRYIERQYLDPNHTIDRWVRKFLHVGRPTETGTLLATLTHAIKESFSYARRSESGTQDPMTTLANGQGSCRDLALFMMEAARSLGLAARYVSGYLYVPDRDGARYVGGGATHAWCQVYLPGAGWVEFDPTNAIIGNHHLIRVAVTRDPRQALPLSGTWFGVAADHVAMDVEVHVTASVAEDATVS